MSVCAVFTLPLNLTLSCGLAACFVPARYPVDCVRVLLVVVVLFRLFLVRARLRVRVLAVLLRRRVSRLGLSGSCRLALPQQRGMGDDFERRFEGPIRL